MSKQINYVFNTNKTNNDHYTFFKVNNDKFDFHFCELII